MKNSNLTKNRMRFRLTETKFNSAIGGICHLFSSAACFGAVVLICSSAPAQNLFMSDGYSGINRNLGNIYKIGPDGAPRLFASGLNGPLGLAFDNTGNLFVASFGGAISKFTPDGRQSNFAMGLNQPEGLAFDGAGNLFVTDGGSILEFAPNGARTIFASGFGRAAGLAFDGTGNLFVADQLSGNIDKFTPSGMRSTFASGLSSPFDLAFDTAGNLFVTDWGNGRRGHLYKFTPDGVQSTFAHLGAPEGLAFDSTGNLFVVDEDTAKIFMFTPEGVRSTFTEPVGLGMDEVAFLAFQPGLTSPPTVHGPRSPRHNHRKKKKHMIYGLSET
jgi:DNA-binding beta-propeller fold protein YncE